MFSNYGTYNLQTTENITVPKYSNHAPREVSTTQSTVETHNSFYATKSEPMVVFSWRFLWCCTSFRLPGGSGVQWLPFENLKKGTEGRARWGKVACVDLPLGRRLLEPRMASLFPQNISMWNLPCFGREVRVTESGEVGLLFGRSCSSASDALTHLSRLFVCSCSSIDANKIGKKKKAISPHTIPTYFFWTSWYLLPRLVKIISFSHPEIHKPVDAACTKCKD